MSALVLAFTLVLPLALPRALVVVLPLVLPRALVVVLPLKLLGLVPWGTATARLPWVTAGWWLPWVTTISPVVPWGSLACSISLTRPSEVGLSSRANNRWSGQAPRELNLKNQFMHDTGTPFKFWIRDVFRPR